jgi:hypothetical protein
MPFATLRSMAATKKSDLTWTKLFGVRVTQPRHELPVEIPELSAAPVPSKRAENVRTILGEQITPEQVAGILHKHRYGRDEAVAAKIAATGEATAEEVVRYQTSRLRNGDVVLDDFAKEAMALTEVPPAVSAQLPAINGGPDVTELHRQDALSWPSHPVDGELEIRRLELQIALMEQKRLDFVTVREQARLDLLAHSHYVDGNAARKRLDQMWEHSRRMGTAEFEQKTMMDALAMEEAARRRYESSPAYSWGQDAQNQALEAEMKLDADLRMQRVNQSRQLRGLR